MSEHTLDDVFEEVQDLKDQINEIKNEVVSVKKQTTITNGRVTKLEKFQAYSQGMAVGFKSSGIAVWAVIVFIVTVSVSLYIK